VQVLNRHQREKLHTWGKTFKRRMLGLFTNWLVVCSWCGTSTFKSDAGKWHRAEMTSELAAMNLKQAGLVMVVMEVTHMAHLLAGDTGYGPAAWCNPFVAPHTLHPNGGWWQCPHCHDHDAQRAHLNVVMEVDYMWALVLGDPRAMMLLSFLDAPLDLHKWREGYTHGKPGVTHILDSPLLAWHQVDNQVELRVDPAVLQVYGYNLRVNPAYQEFQPLIEQGREQRGYPTVDVSILGPRSRANMHMDEAVFDDSGLGLLEDLSLREDTPSKHSMYEVCGRQAAWH
jgi:hypothetical protein